MLTIGLTGSIGMGKSTAAALLRRDGVPVHDADASVHRLLGRGGRAVAAVAAAFPESLVGGAIDRARLGKIVFGDAAALKRLEAILHPLARLDRDRFKAAQARRRAPLIVLDVPLLFETGADSGCDAVLVVSAPGFVQRARVLRRPGMTETRLATILARQTPDAEKRARADFVIPTGQGKRVTLRHLRRALYKLRMIS